MSNQSSDLLAVPRAAERGAKSTASIRAVAMLAADLGGVVMASAVAIAWTIGRGAAPALGSVLGADSPGLVESLQRSGWSTLLVMAALLASLAARGRYTQRAPFWTEAARLCVAVAVALLADSFIRTELYATAPGLPEILPWLLFPPCAMLFRQVARAGLQARGLWTVKTLIVGDGQAVVDTRAALSSDPSLGYEVVGSIGLHRAVARRLGHGGIETLRTLGAEFVVVAMSGRDPVAENGVAAMLARAEVPFALVPAVDGIPVSAVAKQYFMAHDVMLLTCGNNLARPACRAAKALFDQAVAAVALALLSPVFLVICALIRLDGGPAFFGHGRLGEGGQRFRCLKFRSMSVNSDRILKELLERDPAARLEWEATQKLRHDPRVTRIGQVLRQTSLDELPQLLNVLRGEMSLVGPRPIVDAEVPRYGERIGFYYETKPGMTGLWQVSGRSNTTYEDRVRLDVWYVRNWTLMHDVAILLKTIPAVLLKHGAV